MPTGAWSRWTASGRPMQPSSPTASCAPPRLAGVEPGGEVAISSSRLEVRQSLVWVYLEYRWLSMTGGLAREGKATILLTPRAGGSGWRIVHAHSSTSGARELGSWGAGELERLAP